MNKVRLLTRNELNYVVNNLVFSKHSLQRMKERNSEIWKAMKDMRNPLIAYINTDGSINIAPTNRTCYVVEKDRNSDRFVLVTYKDKTHIPMTQKYDLALKGIERKTK